MKPLKHLVVLGVAALLASTANAAQTNLVQTLQINLTAYTQGPNITNGQFMTRSIHTTRITTRQVIDALGSATGNEFSPRAELVVVKPLPDGNPAVVIRDRGTRVGVTRFFEQGRAEAGISRARINLETGVATGSEYSLHEFLLKDHTNSPALPLHFELSGMARATVATLLNSQGHVLGAAHDYAALVTGTGDIKGKPALLNGTISGKGRAIEIVP